MQKPWYTYLYVKSPIAKILWGIVSIVIAFVAILALFVMEDSRMEAQTGNWDGRSIEKGAEIFANNCYTCHGPNGQGASGPALNSRYFFEHRLQDIGFAGTLEDYVKLTVSAGRPSNAHSQWGVIMPTWSNRFGGPLRDDQVQQVTDYVMNWESTALLQTPEEDPFRQFANIPPTASADVSGTAGITATAGVSGTAGTTGTVAAGPRSAQVLFTQFPEGGMGCIACHNVTEPETETSRGLVGPNLGNLAEHAGTRVPGQDAQTYVHNSIITPDAFYVPGYPQGVMPKDFAQRMTPEEIDALVNWLLDPNRVQ